MTKILWFARHSMTDDQLNALKKKFPEGIEINQINRTIATARELVTEINEADVIAIVAPIGLQAEFLRLAGGDKPVIVALAERILIKQEGEEDKTEFRFIKWERIKKIVVEKEDFAE